MIIPKYWAECRVQHLEGRKPTTVRRFGWSMISQAEAQQNADARAADALQRIITGESLMRREPKQAYNGADGVPIREEIVEQFGNTIITRNAYGSLCLNTPNVFFADIDFDERTSCSLTMWTILILSLAGVAVGTWQGSVSLAIVLLVLAIPLGNLLAWAFNRSMVNSKGGSEQIALDRIRAFVDQNPSWGVRVYRTPLGLRMIATHQLFVPSDREVTECFQKIAADPRYVIMCEHQACFRARVSPKPWRIGVVSRLGGGVWPVAPEMMHARLDWVSRYETLASKFASCRFLESLGNGGTQYEVRSVVELHDRMCQANSELPIA